MRPPGGLEPRKRTVSAPSGCRGTVLFVHGCMQEVGRQVARRAARWNVPSCVARERIRIAAALTLALFPVQGLLAVADTPPNIVLIVTDDQGWWDLSGHGNKDIETPNLDRLAAEGVEIRRFYVQPVCAPTRAGLLTGRHYLRTGVYNTRFGGDTLHLREQTIANLLRDAGYRTGMFGKWHLGEYRRYHPDQRGFDEAIYFTAGHTERYWEPDALLRNGRRVHVRGHITDVLTDAASSFVRSRDERPFFLYLAYNVPHTPLIVSDALHEKYLSKGVASADARIYGLLEQCDAAIGRLLGVIDAEGIRDRTAVFFISDNGGVSRHFRAGLRGGKGSVYEGGVLSPFFARWPGRFEPGRATDARGSHLDIFPTFLEMAGSAHPSGRALDGKSLLPLLEAKTELSPHESLVHIWDRHRPSPESRWAIAGKRFKLVGDELYDLSADPGEQRDIAAQQPGIAAAMRRDFLEWLDEAASGKTFEPVPVPVGDELEDPVDLMPSWARHKGQHASVVMPRHRGPVPPAPVGDQAVEESTVYTFGAYYWDTIEGWREPGESVRWKIDVAQAGEYRITLVYGCEHRDAGGEFAVAAAGAELRGRVRPTPGRTFFESHDAGTLQLPEGVTELSVRVVSSRGRDLMALNRLRISKADQDGFGHTDGR